MTPWTVAQQAPLSMGFPRQEYWSGLPFLSPGNLPDPEIEPASHMCPAPASHMCPALAGGFFTTEPSEKAYVMDRVQLLALCQYKQVLLSTLSQSFPLVFVSLSALYPAKPTLFKVSFLLHCSASDNLREGVGLLGE